MKKLNMDEKFVEIMKAYGIDTDTVSLNKDGSINCNVHGNWTYSSSKEIAYQNREATQSSWRMNDNKLEFLEKKSIDDKSFNYGSDLDKKFLKDIAPDLLKELNSFLKEDIKCIWLDVGSSIYDLHLEIGINKDKTSTGLEYSDFYFNKSKDKKTLVPSLNEQGDLSNIVSKDTVEKLIIAIDKIKRMQELENKTITKRTFSIKNKLRKDTLER